jgi:spore coat protein U-like protein
LLCCATEFVVTATFLFSQQEPHFQSRLNGEQTMRISRVVRALSLTGGFALTMGVAAPAAAQSQQANLSVAAAVSKNCTITATAISFTAYDPVVANDTDALDGAGGLSVACTKGVNPALSLGGGGNASGAQRQLAFGSERLRYDLFSDSTRTSTWTTSTSVTMGVAPSKVARPVTVYGRIAGGQDVPAGSYTDTLLATVNF